MSSYHLFFGRPTALHALVLMLVLDSILLHSSSILFLGVKQSSLLISISISFAFRPNEEHWLSSSFLQLLSCFFLCFRSSPLFQFPPRQCLHQCHPWRKRHRLGRILCLSWCVLRFLLLNVDNCLCLLCHFCSFIGSSLERRTCH